MIQQKIQKIRDQIRETEQKYGRESGSVDLLAVSKRQSVSSINEAYAQGQRFFGESYVQEALDKQQLLKDLGIDWHFIGPLQSNKTRDIAANFDWVHSVEREKVARRLNDQRTESQPLLNVCIQVNLENEASKSGVTLQEIPDLAEKIANMPRLRLRGLMAIPVRHAQFDDQRRVFSDLRKSQEKLIARGYELDTLSMGMSGDWQAAIAEGATMIRLGTALFGARD